LNERVKELATLSTDFARKEDVEVLARLLKVLPGEIKPATALKKGPACLFCGRAKTSLRGQMSPRTAATVGHPPVRSFVNEVSGTEFVYGDNQAYKMDRFQSFPHLNAIPEIPPPVPDSA
jgi:hypothetical protein